MTTHDRRGKRFTATVGIAGLVGAGIMGVVVGSATASHDTEESPVAIHGGYEQNESGMSFGSLADEHAEGEPPELVLVENSAGVEGYVFNDDIETSFGPAPTSPQEAVAMEQERAVGAAERVSSTIPMYESDGETYLGEWDGLADGLELYDASSD